ncbi:MAG: hypothetical protein DRI61_00910 [Chloroflexi bacterium]|nr:MAG: hypothetical protein DRI61_00910 [Chloroflexota bacterium]
MEKITYRDIILSEIKRIQDKHKNDPPEEKRYWKKIVNTLLLDLEDYEVRKRAIIPIDLEYEDFFEKIWFLIEELFFRGI